MVSILPWAAYCYNSSFHTVVFGKEPPSILRYEPQLGDTPSLQEQLQTRDVLLDSLKQNIQKAQLRMKIQADHHRRELEYNVSDFVYVKLQPYRQHSLRLIRNKKLSMRYFGPFPIIERIGPVTYKLILLSSAHIHPIFHVSVLKKCEGPPQLAYLPESFILNEKGFPLQPQSLLGNRMIKKNA